MTSDLEHLNSSLEFPELPGSWRDVKVFLELIGPSGRFGELRQRMRVQAPQLFAELEQVEERLRSAAHDHRLTEPLEQETVLDAQRIVDLLQAHHDTPASEVDDFTPQIHIPVAFPATWGAAADVLRWVESGGPYHDRRITLLLEGNGEYRALQAAEEALRERVVSADPQKPFDDPEGQMRMIFQLLQVTEAGEQQEEQAAPAGTTDVRDRAEVLLAAAQ